jgi:D-threonate/D-erythronate kinase
MVGGALWPARKGRRMSNCLILADDLSGAADSAVSALDAGLEAEVFLTPDGAPESRAGIVAIDLNTREAKPETARRATIKSLQELHPPAQLFLYRKVDSTLRGNVAVELAATLAGAGRQFVLFAPAFPANRRVTINGKILVEDQPLEQTQFSSATNAGPDLVMEMANVGLKMDFLPLETVRRGKQEIHRTVSDLVAEGSANILCDAESDEDLFQIAQAGFEFGPQCLFAGSGGLAKQLFRLFSAGDLIIPVPRRLSELVLIAVGSLAQNSQTQFAELSSLSNLDCVRVGPEEFRTRSALQTQFERAVLARHDLAVAIDGNAVFGDGSRPSYVLAGLLTPILNRIGALVATGGETCRALLELIGAQRLQLLHELEPGVALAFVSSPRPLLVVVKAGGFGEPGTLRNAYNYLKQLRA